jgi:anhydro-N-acetylmuramic acid kinase
MSIRLAIGLMSGTSADGIDAALLETDGEGHIAPRAFMFFAYEPDFRQRLRSATARALELVRPGPDPLIDAVAAESTGLHAMAVHRLLAATHTRRDAVTVIGYHGQTVAHRPDRRWTWQIGCGATLKAATRIPVAHDFRSADVAAGGQGAPLAPGYHRARLGHTAAGTGVLNLGGVGNLTWFAGDGIRWGSFDTGPGNALIDDWVHAHTGRSFDRDGAVAASGICHDNVLLTLADNPWFDAAPPKSLDRNAWDIGACRGLSPGDGAATLTAFTAETVRLALAHVPALARLLVTGGGRHNPVLMAEIARRCGVPAEPVEALGWNGDALEAEAFAWLAVRVLDGTPLSWPETTGVPTPTPGGRMA